MEKPAFIDHLQKQSDDLYLETGRFLDTVELDPQLILDYRDWCRQERIYCTTKTEDDKLMLNCNGIWLKPKV